jgi:hypothetical protein
MLVKWNSDSGVKVVALSDKEDAVGSVRGQVVMLCPGWNEIASDVWPFAEDNMEVEHSNGVFEYKCKIVEEDGKDVRKELTLAEITGKQARDIVQGCYNPYNLEKWADDSKLSSEIRGQVDIQVRKIKEAGEGKE